MRVLRASNPTSTIQCLESARPIVARRPKRLHNINQLIFQNHYVIICIETLLNFFSETRNAVAPHQSFFFLLEMSSRQAVTVFRQRLIKSYSGPLERRAFSTSSVGDCAARSQAGTFATGLLAGAACGALGVGFLYSGTFPYADVKKKETKGSKSSASSQK